MVKSSFENQTNSSLPTRLAYFGYGRNLETARQFCTIPVQAEMKTTIYFHPCCNLTCQAYSQWWFVANNIKGVLAFKYGFATKLASRFCFSNWHGRSVTDLHYKDAINLGFQKDMLAWMLIAKDRRGEKQKRIYLFLRMYITSCLLVLGVSKGS